MASAPPHMQAVIEALQALRGVAKLTAVTIVTEVGTFQRFRRATEMMGYTGLVPSEYSSGERCSTAAGAVELKEGEPWQRQLPKRPTPG